MIIRKMTATFGTLEGKTLELKPGLNVIEAPNEWGKSTWCAFLRAMLYGIDTAQRAKQGQKPDKTLYAPWSGAPMTGSMELAWRGREITLAPGYPDAQRAAAGVFGLLHRHGPTCARADPGGGGGDADRGVGGRVPAYRVHWPGRAGSKRRAGAGKENGRDPHLGRGGHLLYGGGETSVRVAAQTPLPRPGTAAPAGGGDRSPSKDPAGGGGDGPGGWRNWEEQAGQARRQLEEEKSRLAQERERRLQAEREELDACRREAGN